jgi:hypothetical protein
MIFSRKEISSDDIIQRIKEAPSNEAVWIKVLVNTYMWHIQQSQKEALEQMYKVMSGLLERKNMSREEFNILTLARIGNIEGAQLLVQENPEAIRLPFIQDTMIKILREHRNTIDKKLEDIKIQWEDFFIKRPHKKKLFSARELGRAVKLKEKEMKADKSKAGKKAIREDALNETADALGIGVEYLKKRVRFGK